MWSHSLKVGHVTPDHTPFRGNLPLNYILYVSSQVIRRPQMVLNAAAGLVVGVGRYEHITSALRDVLH